jgi:hypothetical protein
MRLQLDTLVLPPCEFFWNSKKKRPELPPGGQPSPDVTRYILTVAEEAWLTASSGT